MKFYKSGLNYSLIDDGGIIEKLPVNNYMIMFNEMEGSFYLEKKDDFKLPKKIYGKDTEFIDRVIKTYKNLGERETLGVLLNGLKGTGKTIDAELIAIQSELPVLFLTKNFKDIKFKNFISSITQEFVLFIDEFEKIYSTEEQESLLSLFDGMLSNKKMVIMTCNKDRINEYFNNRLKRIRYRKTYTSLSEKVVNEVIDDLLINKSEKESLFAVILDIGIVTMDILVSIIEEMNIHNFTAIKAITYLNIVSEKVEYKLSKILHNKEILHIDTFQAPASNPHITWSKCRDLTPVEKEYNKDYSLDETITIDSKKHKLNKIKYGVFEITVPVRREIVIPKNDPDYTEEGYTKYIVEDTTFVIEKETLFV